MHWNESTELAKIEQVPSKNWPKYFSKLITTHVFDTFHKADAALDAHLLSTESSEPDITNMKRVVRKRRQPDYDYDDDTDESLEDPGKFKYIVCYGGILTHSDVLYYSHRLARSIGDQLWSGPS